jgi:hypothetical protein
MLRNPRSVTHIRNTQGEYTCNNSSYRYDSSLAVVVVVGVVPFAEVGGGRPHVGRLRGGGSEQRRPLQAYGQGEGRGGAETGGPAVLVDRSVPHRSREPEIRRVV